MRRLLCALVLLSLPARADWEKFADKEGVLVEWRKIDASRVREIRATGIVEQPLAKLVAALRDLEHFPEFMPPTKEVEILSGQSDHRQIHVTIDPSWVQRRDYCLDVTWAQSATYAESRWYQIWDGCPPPKKNVVRHSRTEGTWRLYALDERRTRVEYQAITDPAGSIPAWIVDRATAKQMRGMYQSLEKRASTLR
jgi:ribosome-associated toxin RatA of RatAB toxin-antitoxin module